MHKYIYEMHKELRILLDWNGFFSIIYIKYYKSKVVLTVTFKIFNEITLYMTWTLKHKPV